ncbi:MAG: hypothetical protein HFE44_11620 [Oscillospiraceae bacterium]|nr:hypothetical protein [Oscillospiraceae bacterium]
MEMQTSCCCNLPERNCGCECCCNQNMPRCAAGYEYVCGCDGCGCYPSECRDPFWPSFSHPRWLSLETLYSSSNCRCRCECCCERDCGCEDLRCAGCCCR